MSYASIADMARVATKGWDDLAQRAVQDARATGAQLRTVAEGGDTSGFDPAQLARLQAAVALLTDILQRTSRYADGYILPRYQHRHADTGVPGGPLPAELIAGSDVPTAVATIALRRLMGTAIDRDTADNTRWADQYLRDIADGRVTLGRADSATPQPPGRMISSTVCKSIAWEHYPL